MSNSLSKLIVLKPTAFDQINKKITDSNFLQRKLLPIFASHSLKDINKWYEIKQELAKYLIEKQRSNLSPETKTENRWKNLRDNETQTKKIYKKHIKTQTLENKLVDVGTQANFNLPEEVFVNREESDDNSYDMDTTIQKINHNSASLTAKRLKNFSNKGSPKVRKLTTEETKPGLKQTLLTYQHSPRLTRKQRKDETDTENVKWQNI